MDTEAFLLIIKQLKTRLKLTLVLPTFSKFYHLKFFSNLNLASDLYRRTVSVNYYYTVENSP